jgi:hypothetical protein
MRDGIRDRVNIPIDSKLKRLFEDLQQRHRKSWTEVLETAVRELLVETDPIQILEFEIKIGEEKQEERRQALIRARSNIQVLGPTQIIDPGLEKKREEQFEKDKSFLPKQIIRGEANWSRIFYHYEFENKKDALAWFRPRIELIEQMKELEKKR